MNWRVLLRPWCWIFGHRRGVFIREVGGVQLRAGGVNFVGEDGNPLPQQRIFSCPRCGRQTRYKVQPPNRGTPTDGSPAMSPAEQTVQYLERQREKLR